MKKRLFGLIACAGLICGVQVAQGEFGTGFGSGPSSLFFDGLGVMYADGCLEALVIMGIALVVDLIRFGIIHPLVQDIRDSLHHRKLRGPESLRGEDPRFNPDEVTEWARNLYTRLQHEWETEPVLSVREHYFQPVESELGEKILRVNRKRFDMLKGRNLTVHTADIAFRNIAVTGWYPKRKRTVLELEMQVERKAWYTGRKGQKGPGDPDVLKRVTHTWRLSRPAGAVTPPEKRQCGCGQAVSYLFGECPWCGKTLERPADAWVLEKIIEDTKPPVTVPNRNTEARPAFSGWERQTPRMSGVSALDCLPEMLIRTGSGEWGAGKDELILPDIRIPYADMATAKYSPDDSSVKIGMKTDWNNGPRHYTLLFNDKTRKKAKAACKYMNQRIQEYRQAEQENL